MKEILKTLLFVGVFPMFIGLFGIFSGKMDEFLFGLALVAPFPLVLFFLLALISKDKNKFLAEINATGSPKYQLYSNNSGIAITTNGKIIVSTGAKAKSYDFNAVREWRTSIQTRAWYTAAGSKERWPMRRKRLVLPKIPVSSFL